MEVADIEVGFEYGAGDGATEREIIRNVEMIMATPVGSSPLYRDFGVDNSMLDKPLDVARSLYAVAVMEAVDRWEPRARAEQVTLTPEASGKLRAKAVIVLAYSHARGGRFALAPAGPCAAPCGPFASGGIKRPPHRPMAVFFPMEKSQRAARAADRGQGQKEGAASDPVWSRSRSPAPPLQ